MSYQTSSKRSPPFWLLIGARQLLCFSAQPEARKAATVWNWSGKSLSPRALLAFLYFSSCHIFPPVQTFPRPQYLPLGLRGWPPFDHPCHLKFGVPALPRQKQYLPWSDTMRMLPSNTMTKKEDNAISRNNTLSFLAWLKAGLMSTKYNSQTRSRRQKLQKIIEIYVTELRTHCRQLFFPIEWFFHSSTMIYNLGV